VRPILFTFMPETVSKSSSEGVVIGFVISYRVSCGYDQYWMGRTAWSNVVKNIQTLSRLIWFHVPLRLTPKTPQELAQPVAPPRSKEEAETVMGEKRVALELLEGFATSLKHHLRGEQGIYYDDLYDLVKPLHEHPHNITSKSPNAADRPWLARGKSGNGPLIPPITAYGSVSISRTVSSSSRSVRPALLPASSQHSPSLIDRVSADLIPFAASIRGFFNIFRSNEISDTQPGIDIVNHAGVQRQWATGVPVLGRKGRARGNENLPVEIIRLLSDWFAILEERMTVPGTSLGAMIEYVAALEDSLAAAERTLTTPLPLCVGLIPFTSSSSSDAT
jgi:putative membrane protein